MPLLQNNFHSTESPYSKKKSECIHLFMMAELDNLLISGLD